MYPGSCLYRRRRWHPAPVLLPGKSHGRRSMVGCSPWGRKESDTTSLFTFHFHALEKEMATHSSVLAWRIPGTGEPCWAAVYGVAQSRTQLKWLSSSSSSCLYKFFHNDLIFWFVMRYVMSIFWKAFLGMTSFLVVDAFGSQLILTNVARTCYTNAVLPKRKLCVYF